MLQETMDSALTCKRNAARAISFCDDLNSFFIHARGNNRDILISPAYMLIYVAKMRLAEEELSKMKQHMLTLFQLVVEHAEFKMFPCKCTKRKERSYIQPFDGKSLF